MRRIPLLKASITMALMDQITKVQGQTLDTIADSQKRALDVNEKVAEVLKDRVPAVKLPFVAVLPSPADGVKLYFDFAGKLLAGNRKFAENMVAAWATSAPKATAPRATVPKATAPKATAPKATAPKATAKVAPKATARRAAPKARVTTSV